MKVLVGADPEVFVRSNGVVVSGHGLVPGTKTQPHKVDKGAVQVDGMALEFNIDPAATEEEFKYNIKHVLNQLRKMVPNHELELEAVAEFEADYMASQPEVAKLLGCDPDFNAYTVQVNKMPDGSKTMRTAAGHVHVGWTEGQNTRDPLYQSSCATLMKQMDCLLGIPSLLFDDCDKRREMYGKAGAFRPKSYGAEYRVLSNKWLQSDNLMSFVYNNTIRAVEDLQNGTHWYEVYPEVEMVINTSDRVRAHEIMNEMGVELAW